MNAATPTTRAGAQRQTGLGLIELMVALVIGSVLISGAVFVYIQSRNSYATNDTLARLQENARYALSVLEPDVRMTSFWGLVNDPDLVNGRDPQTAPVSAIAPSAAANACGNNYAVDLFNTVQATDAGYTFGIGRTAACNPGPAGSAAQPNADTLTLRRASADTAAAVNGTIQVWSTRILGALFSNGTPPGAFTPFGQINNLIVNTYYVSQGANGRPTIPSLRRKMLIAGPAFQDDEIVTGIEDLQVQLGIDPTGFAGSATQYVNPGAAVPVGSQVVAVRVWVLVRADAAEVGFTDNRTYTYGNRVYTPADGFRRVLFSRTIQLRNSLG